MAKKVQSSQGAKMSAKRRREMELDRRRRNRQIRTALVVIVVLVVLGGLALLLLNSDSDEQAAAGSEVDFGEPGPLAAMAPAERADYYDQPPEMTIDTDKEYEAVIRTEKGDLRLRLFAEASPQTVNNFVYLARDGYYDGTVFHRVIQDFMAQAGDPTGTGGGGPGYEFADEVDNGRIFDRPGLLAMANRGANTNGSQFFITYGPTPWLDGAHTIFGELIAGQEVLNSLTLTEPGSPSAPPGDVIERIAIIER
jgi:cyclophilin family peptidyl-prolyl cis-trans isomerase